MCTSENLEMLMEEYLRYCLYRKRLDEKTVRAYRTDLLYFNRFIEENALDYQDKVSISQYVDRLHSTMAPRTVKRKIASVKAFFHYLEYKEIIRSQAQMVCLFLLIIIDDVNLENRASKCS